jgi:hypothetical protein
MESLFPVPGTSSLAAFAPSGQAPGKTGFSEALQAATETMNQQPAVTQMPNANRDDRQPAAQTGELPQQSAPAPLSGSRLPPAKKKAGGQDEDSAFNPGFSLLLAGTVGPNVDPSGMAAMISRNSSGPGEPETSLPSAANPAGTVSSGTARPSQLAATVSNPTGEFAISGNSPRTVQPAQPTAKETAAAMTGSKATPQTSPDKGGPVATTAPPQLGRAPVQNLREVVPAPPPAAPPQASSTNQVSTPTRASSQALSSPSERIAARTTAGLQPPARETGNQVADFAAGTGTKAASSGTTFLILDGDTVQAYGAPQASTNDNPLAPADHVLDRTPVDVGDRTPVGADTKPVDRAPTDNSSNPAEASTAPATDPSAGITYARSLLQPSATPATQKSAGLDGRGGVTSHHALHNLSAPSPQPEVKPAEKHLRQDALAMSGPEAVASPSLPPSDLPASQPAGISPQVNPGGASHADPDLRANNDKQQVQSAGQARDGHDSHISGDPSKLAARDAGVNLQNGSGPTPESGQNASSGSVLPAPPGHTSHSEVSATAGSISAPNPAATGEHLAAPDACLPAGKPPAPAVYDSTPLRPLFPGDVHAARMVDRLGQQEMHIDLHTTSFGSVEVHTAIHDSRVDLAVGSERGDLRSFLISEVPPLQANLAHHDLHFENIRFLSHDSGRGAGFSGGADSQPRSFRQHAATRMSFVAGSDEDSAEETTGEVMPGLSLHA